MRILNLIRCRCGNFQSPGRWIPWIAKKPENIQLILTIYDPYYPMTYLMLPTFTQKKKYPVLLGFIFHHGVHIIDVFTDLPSFDQYSSWASPGPTVQRMLFFVRWRDKSCWTKFSLFVLIQIIDGWWINSYSLLNIVYKKHHVYVNLVIAINIMYM